MKSRQYSTIKLVIAIACTAIALTGPAQGDSSPTLSVKRLTMESANAVAQGAIAECRKQGVLAAVTVVDKNGIVQATLRDTLAPPVTLKISKMKAYTAANFSVDTSTMDRLANSPIGRIDGVVMSAGGVVIQIGGVIYGGIGVSGAPSGDIDEKCAKAGLAAVADDLEMADE
ncbi:MAG: heme-binding protein [Gammaproteobacteria bacterium]|nr:heme-binding protein [Gammaproteobacteria bacterium]